jgi:hypothetical protein
VELACAVEHCHRGLTMQVNKVHSVRALALVARHLGENADWLADVAIDMEPEDGLIWVCDPQHQDGTMAFTVKRPGKGTPDRRRIGTPLERLNASDRPAELVGVAQTGGCGGFRLGS